jgi:YbbR domain-containing protein
MSENKGRDQADRGGENKADDSKTELANRIAKQSKKVANTYQHIEDGFVRAIRGFSSFTDKVLFNRKYGKLVALVLAVLMYVIVNFNSNSASLTTPLQNSKDKNNVTVTAKYNTDTFELSGLPATANITISGDASNVTSAANSKGYIVANLEGMTEGQHEVKLTAEGFGDNVTVKIDPSNVIITLKKKTTRQFDLSYDFINQDKMDAIYSPGVPQFEYNKVNVRASKDTLDSIAFVKALIDVSGQTADFTQDAKLVAYDSSGNPVTADIVPNTVKVTVPVTSPNKTVPIEVEVSGDCPDGKAIDSITTDQQTVTIYGTESVLGQIDKVVVTLDATTISKDSTILRPITLPTGVNSSNINQITMDVKVGDGVTSTIDGVKINYKNNTNNYKASQPDNITTTSVTVFGTQANVDAVTADSIYVYVDMTDAKPGLQNFTLQVDQPAGGLVKYSLVSNTYALNVLGETNSDTTETNSGTGTE